MSKTRLLLGLALLATAAWMSPANGAYWHDYWPVSADMNMDCHPSEGYAIAGGGNMRHAKTYHHFPAFAFNAPSDGPDHIQWDKPGDAADGTLLADFLVGKRVVACSMYHRDAANNTCNPIYGQGKYLNDPVVVIGFRVANEGQMTDRSADGGEPPGTGCCAGYATPNLEGGENGPVAWRMGVPPYTATGDAGAGAEYYVVSSYDTTNAGKTVAFVPGGIFTDGLGGWGTTANRFAFGWLVQNSDGHLVNSQTLDYNDCAPTTATSFTGGNEPRDYAADFTGARGWYDLPVDAALVNALANDPETKGIVFQAINAPVIYPGEQPWNGGIHGRDQGGGPYNAYLSLYATVQGDCDASECVDIFDIFVIAESWGAVPGDPNWNEAADLDFDASVNIFDIFVIAEYWGSCIE